MNATELQEKIDGIPYWYHKIELTDGIVTPGWAPINAAQYGIPEDLTGKRVLDVGAWDGYWTFEALRRGAKEVVAIDDFSDTLGSLTSEQRKKWETFDLCRDALGYTSEQAQRSEMSVYNANDLLADGGDKFDVVFFFGTLYHCKYPQLAMDALAKVMTDDGRMYIESAICDDYSPYRGGIGHGHAGNVMEVYPGKQYGDNESNYWVPTLSAVGCMLQMAGMQNVDVWKLEDQPKDLTTCRGFGCGTKDVEDITVRGPGVTNVEVSCDRAAPLKVGAVLSVPRLGFMSNFFCMYEALMPLQLPIRKETGAFWGQCLERGMEDAVDKGLDVILTVDYDTVFKMADVVGLLDILTNNLDVDAIASLQVGRGGLRPLMTQKNASGSPKLIMKAEEVKVPTCPVATAHFGLTMIRTKALMQMAHPWFQGEPDRDGRWGDSRVDPDISFWKQWESVGNTLHLANRIVIGHAEGDVILWPDKKFDTIHQNMNDYYANGKPAEAWE